MPKLEGHRKGIEKIGEMLQWCMDSGVRELTLYCLSTENFDRDQKEVDYLFKLLRDKIKSFSSDKQIHDNKVRIKVVGRLSLFPDDIRGEMEKVMGETAPYTDYSLNLAMAYGSRAEIVDAVKNLVESGEEITEDALGDDEPPGAGARVLGQLLLQMTGIEVPEGTHLGPGQLAAVHDGGVVKLIRVDDIPGALHERLDNALVGQVPGTEETHTLRAHDLGEGLLEAGVDIEVPGHQPGCARAGAQVVGCPGRGFGEGGVSCKSEVIVGGEADHQLGKALHAHLPPGWGYTDQRPAQPLPLKESKAGTQLLVRGGRHRSPGSTPSMTKPASRIIRRSSSEHWPEVVR